MPQKHILECGVTATTQQTLARFFIVRLEEVG